jgi:hypothetical protein
MDSRLTGIVHDPTALAMATAAKDPATVIGETAIAVLAMVIDVKVTAARVMAIAKALSNA